MRRFLIAIPVACAVAAGVAGVSGAFSPSHSGPKSASAPMNNAMAAMTSTPAPASSAGGPVRMELHQRVVKVQIKNFAFVPARVEVSPGTRMVWTNQDSDPHTVTTDKPGFSSQALNTGQTYVHRLLKPGTFAYHCTIHPFMHGTVVVQG